MLDFCGLPVFGVGIRVMLRGLCGVMRGVMKMPLRYQRMMRRRMLLARFVPCGGFAMMTGRMLMMFGRFLVMLDGWIGHKDSFAGMGAGALPTDPTPG